MNDQEMDALLARLDRESKWIDRFDYALMPVGWLITGLFAYQFFRESRVLWRLWDAGFGIWMLYTAIRTIERRIHKHRLRNHEHSYVTIAIYSHAEIDESDPIRHTQFYVMGCAACRQTMLFPFTNAMMITKRFAAQVRAELKKNGWDEPPMLR